MPNSPETNRHASSVAEQKSEAPQIETREHITREDLRAEREKIFLFGDNLAERGLGGQAREMRGEENAVGIPTKKAPDNNQASFFTDKEFADNKRAIDKAFGRIPREKIIVIPKAGIGTGLAQMAEKAPQTFAYLNEKLAEIGFDNELGKSQAASKNASQNKTSNAVIVQSNLENPPAEKRLLDLNDIKTRELLALAPSRAEVDALKTNRTEALAEYADRLRQDYKENKNGLREGFKILSDVLDRGGQITVSCTCRVAGSRMCHADVVKMAVEKVSLHLKNQKIQEKGGISRADDKNINRANSKKQDPSINPRTQRAINEILSRSENDKLLETISQTEGRNRSEQASFLGKSSQFVRDIYERGANVIDGKLIIPTENLNSPKPLAVTTQEYAVKKLSEILKDESRAKEIAPLLTEYAGKISGLTSDGETKIKVFNWIYDSLEGKGEFLDREGGDTRQSERNRFETTLEKIAELAAKMHELEPLDKIELVPLAGLEFENNHHEFDYPDENRLVEEIYEEAVSRDAADSLERGEQTIEESVQDFGQDGKTSAEAFERIDLRDAPPRLPEEFSELEITHLLTKTLPEIDRRLENGEPVKSILADFHQIVRQSAQEDALNRLEKIYQRQNAAGRKTTETGGLSQGVLTQIGQIDLRRQNVIELKSPGEFLAAWDEAHRTFYRKSKQEIGSLLEKLDAARERQQTSGDKSEEILLKKQLNQNNGAKPSFAYKLENSREIVAGYPSAKALEERNFVADYINYQLKQPETRLRFESERYRAYAAQLESATTRSEVMKTASVIRAENASLGLSWKALQDSEKDKLPRPLSRKEMQFLFTETSPAHYTQAMTVARLSYAHAGASRRAITESLLKGEIKPSAEANKLIESLESRLNRRELKDSISATRHFFESLKTPNENLKIKNEFDHAEVYRSLPPQEKDFVYRKTTQQKENLKYRSAYEKSQFSNQKDFSRIDSEKLPGDAAEQTPPQINETVPQPEVAQNSDPAKTEKQEESKVAAAEDLTESKPLSLKLYENEIARAEKKLVSKILGEKLSAGAIESKNNLNVEAIFTPKEREKFKLETGEIAKQRLEPKELDADHRKISRDASRQAIETFKQLEQAHNLYQFSNDKAKINEAFLKLDREAAQLNKIRQDYNRSEKLAVLRASLKTDIADLLKKNPSERGQKFVEQTSRILAQNIEKAGVILKSSENSQVEKLSLEIINRIEAKQKPEIRESAGLSQSQNLTNQNQTKTNTTPKFEKGKDSFVFVR